MKKLSFILILIVLSGAVFAQDSKEDRKAAKKARKEEKKRIALENSAKLKAIVETKMFVLEAHTLFDKGGITYNLSPTTNFVGFDGKNSTIQLSFDNLVGWNGIGGITIDGQLQKVEINAKDNKSTFTANVNVVNKVGGLVTMIFRVSSDGSARVDMSGSYGERLSFQGYIVELSESKIYKGVPIF